MEIVRFEWALMVLLSFLKEILIKVSACFYKIYFLIVKFIPVTLFRDLVPAMNVHWKKFTNESKGKSE